MQSIFIALMIPFFGQSIMANQEQQASEDNETYQLLEQQCAVPLIYAPWREIYDVANAKAAAQGPKKCPFCREMHANNDEQYLILRRFRYNVVALNVFPYSKGHLLIIPFEHTAHLKNLLPQARAEMMELANLSLEILEKVYHAPGANIGFNMGNIAGASIVDHLHMHIVPRHLVPSFMQIIGKTEVITFDVQKVYTTLKKEFDVVEIRRADEYINDSNSATDKY